MARKLVVEIIGDDRSLLRTFQRSSRAGQDWGRNLDKAGRGALVATVGFRGLGRSIAFATSSFLAGAGATVGIKAAVSAASDLHEEINKTAVVFGKASAGVLAWSKTTGNAMGIARSDALAAAGSFGQLLEVSGLNAKSAAAMSQKLVGLASDIASFNNIDTSDALEKLRAGLVGEVRPLREVGVLLSESRVKQEAYRLGLAKAGKELTDQQKIQARYSIILKDTAKQQGDFARTSDGLANASRRVRASLRDVAASIGTAITPALAKATSRFADFLGRIGEAHTIHAKLSVVWEGAAGAARGAESALGQAISRIDFGKVWENARGIADGFQQRLNEIDFGKVGKRIGDGISSAARVALPAAKDIADRISTAVASIDFVKLGKKMGPGLAAAVATAFVTLTDPAFWVKNWDLALAVGLTVFGGSIGRFAGKLVGPLIAKLVVPFTKVGPRIGSALETGLLVVAENLGRVGGRAFLTVVEGIGRVFARVPRLVTAALAPLVAIAGRIFGKLGRLGRFTVKVLGVQAAINALTGLAQRVAAIMAGIGATIGNAFKTAFQFVLREAIKTALGIVEPFSHIPRRLGGGPFQDLKRVLQNALDGMSQGADKAGKQIAAGISRGSTASRAQIKQLQKVIDSLKGKSVDVVAEVFVRPTGTQIRSERPDVAAVAADTKPPKPKFTAEQRNKFFDDAIGRAQDRVQDITSLQGQLGALQQIASLIQQRIARTKDITRQLTLEGRLRDVFRQEKQIRLQLAQDATDALNVRLARAETTATLKDDIQEGAKIIANLQARIRQEGRTTDLLAQLDQAKAAQAQRGIDQRTRLQFRALGLGPTGDKLIPSVANLRKQLASLTDRKSVV